MKKIVLLFSIFIISFLGCQNPLNVVDPGNNTDTVELRLSVDDSQNGARSVAPDPATAIAKYTLSGSKDGGAVQILGDWDSLTNRVLDLEAGVWDFTLQGKHADGVAFVQGRHLQVTLRDQPVNLVFKLEPLASGLGTVEITMNWPASVDVDYIVPIFDGVAEDAIDVSAVDSYIYTKSAEKGGYTLFLSFCTSDPVDPAKPGIEIALIPEYIKILANMTSAAAYTLETTDFNSAPVIPTDFAVASGEDFTTEATGSLAFSWTDASINELAFEIESSVDGNEPWTIVNDAIAAGSSSLKVDLDRGETRYYRLRAVNNFGASAWTPAVNYTVPWLVSFDTDGGSAVSGQEIADGGTAIEPVAAEKYGKLFGGWYTDNTFATAFDFSTTISANTTIYASWTSAVIFKAGKGEGTMATITAWAEGSTNALPANTFTRTGYDFVGWSRQEYGAVHFADGANYTMAASGDTLYARWNRSDARPAGEFSTEDAGDGGLRITRYSGNPDTTAGHVIIPDMINGKPVTQIYNRNGHISSSDYYWAFNYRHENRTRLKEISLPETIKIIGGAAFRWCQQLKKINFNGDRLHTIGNGAFDVTGFTELVLPDSVVNIHASAFQNCDQLISISMPSVNVIPQQAFYQSEKLETVNWGDALTSIGTNAFGGCTSFKSAIIPDTITSIGQSAFHDSGLSELRLPDKHFTIGTNAFAGLQSLVDNVDLGNALRSLPDGAFRWCRNLTTIKLPDTLSSIGQYAFAECDKLTNVDMGKSLVTIGNYAFDLCKSLVNVTLPDTVTEIGQEAFDGCNKLQTIYLGNKLQKIGQWAFRSCHVLKSIEIPDTVYSMGHGAFENCFNLSLVKLSAGQAVIPTNAFYNCSSISEIVIPDAVSQIQTSAFYGNIALRKLTLGTGLTSIGNNAFEKCRNLLSVTFPDALTSLGQQAFIDCTNLQTVTFGNGLKVIPQKAFWANRNLVNVQFGTAIETIDSWAFNGCRSIQSLDFPESLRTINEAAFGGCESLTSINFKPYVQSLGYYAFAGCDSLLAVDLPRDLMTLGEGAFRQNSALERISMGNKLVTIPKDAFFECGNLQNFEFGSSIATIGDGAFQSCNSLTKLDLSSVVIIGRGVFAYSASLKEVELGSYIAVIGIDAFNGCSSLDTVIVKALTPPVLSGVANFSGNAANRKFYVTNMEDDSVLDTYKAANNWHLMADAIVEGDFTPPAGMLKLGVYSSNTNTAFRLKGLAFNSRGELYGVHNDIVTSGNYRVYGPIGTGEHSSDYSGYAKGGFQYPKSLVFDNDDNLYVISDWGDSICKVADGGGTLVQWNVTNLVVPGDREPIWGGIAPGGFNGSNINPGDLVVLDCDWDGGVPFVTPTSYVMRFSPADASDRSIFFTGDNTSFSDPYSAAFGDDELWVSAARGLFRLDANGNCTQVSTNPSRWIAVHPVNQKVYFGGSNNPAKVWCYNPADGTTQLVAHIPTLLDAGFKTCVFTPDGTKMLIPDNYRILELTGF